ncbi:MAG: thiamine biosynthesis protein ApbE [Rhodospirillaceae bacterium]|jgi:thiamine biosynthesis lipoprotein|nr:thiamine biosynthesis protein ApbE [Rhodospirillaceae bacterium]|tara:strand:- start:555 stop:1613 length:1059 start_codon:yes stop_codon:yes gene_type:complete
MKKIIRRFFAFGTVALLVLGMPLLAGCKDSGEETKSTLNVFGTLVEITIRDTDEQTALKAVEELSGDFQRMHKDWHAWKPGELDDLNKAIAQNRSVTVSPFLLPLLHQANNMYVQSDGLFNPAIGKLVSEWGFHADELPMGKIPDKTLIDDLVSKNPTMEDLIINGTRVSSTNSAVHLDFGGFAKGAALDLAVKRFKSMGIKNAILNAGGDLNVFGGHGDRRWRAGIRHPLDWGVIATVELNPDEGLYTSGNYERYREHEGIRYSHIIDPRTGMPVDYIVSASVIHPNGAWADAAATALSVAGTSDWVRIARSMKINYALLVDKDGVVYLTPEMKERVQFNDERPVKVVVSP